MVRAKIYEKYNILRKGEKKAFFGIGVIGWITVYDDDTVKGFMKSAIPEFKGVNFKLEFPSLAIAKLFLQYEDGKNRQQLIKTLKYIQEEIIDKDVISPSSKKDKEE